MQFTSVRFLQLTDEDLRGLGAIAARWAIVEYQTHALLSYLVGSGHPIAVNFPPEPPDQYLDPDTYQTIGKNRRISTRGKVLRQP
jgi:hypothetical protein